MSHAHPPGALAADPNMTGLFMQAPAMIMILEGPELRCTFTNPLFSKLYEGKTLLGRTPREVAPELEGQGYFEMLDAVYTTGEPVYGYEFPGVADWNNEGRDSTKYFNMVYSPYMAGGKTAGVMIFGFEVTTQVLARQRAAQEEERLRRMLNALPQMAWTATPDGTLEYFNDRWFSFTGQEPAAALAGAWSDVIPEAERPELSGKWQHSLRTGTVFEAEVHYRRHDGTLRWHSARAEPIRDERGDILYWLGVSSDIHEQKAASENLERIVSERTLALRRSNEELEQFAYIASHDLKEPLRKILVFTERLLDPDGAGNTAYLNRIRDAATRMKQLVDDLLEFSSVRTEAPDLAPVALDEVLAEALQDQELRIQETGAAVTVESLPVVHGIRYQLHQLLGNLLANALKYTRAGVTPKVTISAAPATEDELARFPELDPTRRYHSIVVADNGIGFTAEQAGRIFTLFQRLHSREAYAGTGVGLALCRKVARGHGGEIRASGIPGEGAVFQVLLPVA